MAVTQRKWATTLLRDLGIRPNPRNVGSVVAWERAEGGHFNNTARFNPLNTTQPMPGAGNTGTQGNIKVYRDWEQGLKATVRTLRNGNYGGILAALKHGSPQQVASAIGASPWGTSGGLVSSVLSSTGPVKPAQHLIGGASSPSPSRSVGSKPAQPGLDPGTASQAAVTALTAQLASARPLPPVSSSVPSAPSFSARNALPSVPATPVSSGAIPMAKTSTLQDTLDAIRTAGQTLPNVASSGPSGSPKTTPGAGTGTSSGTNVQSLKQALRVVAKGGAPTGLRKINTKTTFDGTPVAGWIAPILAYARKQGWTGTVNSGYRDPNEVVHPSPGLPVAPQGQSNHNFVGFPGGAVDVSQAAQLAKILKRSPYANTLVWAGSKDPVHFSHPHQGHY